MVGWIEKLKKIDGWLDGQKKDEWLVGWMENI